MDFDAFSNLLKFPFLPEKRRERLGRQKTRPPD
jgi:hypothetical protein